jgi:hypothetical protein
MTARMQMLERRRQLLVAEADEQRRQLAAGAARTADSIRMMRLMLVVARTAGRLRRAWDRFTRL